jgi:hypothetical protein
MRVCRGPCFRARVRGAIVSGSPTDARVKCRTCLIAHCIGPWGLDCAAGAPRLAGIAARHLSLVFIGHNSGDRVRNHPGQNEESWCLLVGSLWYCSGSGAWVGSASADCQSAAFFALYPFSSSA